MNAPIFRFFFYFST
ncbi:TPA: pheST operon leader peptide PheM [Klebsiella pneumoniae]|nr:pheST operon leader peptide PheM [Klebsiella pneumoniae]